MKLLPCVFGVYLTVMLTFNAMAAENTDEKKIVGGSTSKKFEASSLWGIRRGPNASPSPSANVLAEELSKKKEKAAQLAYEEEKARQAYLNSLSKTPTPGSLSAAGGSSSKQQECARKT